MNILDIGCGSGYVRKLLNEVGYTGFYIGVDIKKHDEFNDYSHYFNSRLIESKIEDFNTDNRFDIILSITSLEHIENDKLTIDKCYELLKRRGIQLHIVPSYWSLFIHLWHGFRIYGPGQINRLFHSKKYKVYRLGGIFSFSFTSLFITIPNKSFNRTFQSSLLYPKLLESCNRLDRSFPFYSHLYLIIARRT